MRRVTWVDHLHYRFDNLMGRGTVALIGSLAILSAVFIVVAAVVVWAIGIAPAGDQG
ncbi:MAG: hypothetical protein HY691_16070, partial [Chloroflexi bacterium]|nr:hypothetical protein [Chloroflexota bacterium]